MKSAPHRFVDELHKTLARLAAYLAALGGVGLMAADLLAGGPSFGRSDQSEQKSEWIETRRPQPAFALDGGDLSLPEPRYAIRRHERGGGRQDVLTWGTPLDQGRYLRIEIYRPGSEIDALAEPDPDALARAATFALPGEARIVGSLPTKFGTFSAVELAEGEDARHCLGFARAFPELPLRIAGWHCAAGHKATVRSASACVLDHLTLLSAGGDAKLAGLFAKADQRRTFCGDKRPSLSTAPKPTDWLDVPAEPRLRGRFAAL